jgi:2-polyprenyl-3-methyl-5-hydroxy-6-metoxy-1,4-benzoquinol methylase
MMRKEHTNEIRERIYFNYVEARDVRLAPKNPEGLRSRRPYLSRLIAWHFPADKNARILDLGCGYGALVHFARAAGYADIKGVDGSAQQIEAAHALGIDSVQHANIAEVLASCDDETYDVVITFDVIEHFREDELIALVDQVWRILRSGGRWIIHAPNGESPFVGAVLYGDLTHEAAFTRKSIAQLLYSSGFSFVRSFEDMPIPHGVLSAGRRIVWTVIRAALRVYIAAETGDAGRDRIFTQNFLTVAFK